MKLNFKQGLIKLGLMQDPEVKAQPLTAEKAYTIYASEGTRNVTSLKEVYTKFLQSILSEIELISSRCHKTHVLITIPDWFTPELKKLIITDLESLNFKIGYQDDVIILILWR